NVLQGRALVTGNPLLRGWWTSDVSFYTTELPEYALVTAIRGLSPDVVHLCGALTYTLTVLLAAPGSCGSHSSCCSARTTRARRTRCRRSGRTGFSWPWRTCTSSGCCWQAPAWRRESG
ncbi:MAG: hypothetical protein ACRDP7_33205, partial [Trebonia sp.]